ncbi:MAG: hypothetical protein Q8P23_00840 [bacterium]|nr:hypothetical protein [bacterium]
MSGNITILASTGVRARALLVTTGASGGATLLSGDVHSVTVKALSGIVYVGGTAAGDLPFSGQGFLLGNGEAVSMDVDNFNRVSVCAVTSGDLVTYFGII